MSQLFEDNDFQFSGVCEFLEEQIQGGTRLDCTQSDPCYDECAAFNLSIGIDINASKSGKQDEEEDSATLDKDVLKKAGIFVVCVLLVLSVISLIYFLCRKEP